jgi:hypothetical protein
MSQRSRLIATVIALSLMAGALTVAQQPDKPKPDGKNPSGTPTITSLDPDAVPQGWEGTLQVKGSNFDKGSFVLIDGKVPKTTYKSDSLLEAELKKDITGMAGSKVVKVHTGEGSVSNDKTLVVRSGVALNKASSAWGKAKIKSYLVSATSDRTQNSRREIKMLELEQVAGSPFKGVTLIFVEDNPLTDLGSYNPAAQGWVVARTLHRDFDDMYLILRTEKAAYFTWGADEDNKLTWFSITNDGRP